MKWLHNWFKNRYLYYTIKLSIDIVIILGAYIIAFFLRLDFEISAEYVPALRSTMLPLLIFSVCIFLLFKVHLLQWSSTSISDVIRIVLAKFVLTILFFVPVLFLLKLPIPRSIPIIFFVIGCLLINGLRLTYRFIYEFKWKKNRKIHRTLIVGAGNAGEMIIRQMKREAGLGFQPVAVVDDNGKLKSSMINGVSVLGSIDCIPLIVKQKKIEEIIIATPSADVKGMRRIINYCQESGAKYRTLPGPREIISGDVRLNQLREVRIDDLLNREVIDFDIESMRAFVKDKVILITGAGGSIGSELVRQIIRFKPKKIICLDRAENSLFSLNDELMSRSNGNNFQITIADVLDYGKCSKVFQKEQPDFVFHAAAYKHVPLMENHPEEAIHNNIFGTLNMIMLSEKWGIQKFVLISTDKAVNPTSIMGASKRIAEKVVQSFPTVTNLQSIIVRFGNVLGSEGSVVPLFKKQIKRNGPVTVTHKEMTRFFMTIPEAITLILESAKMGKGKEIYILDMGEPMKLRDLAQQMIRLSGFEPGVDIEIKYTGIRPGEKMFEELWTDKEKPEKTSHSKILKTNGSQYKNWDEFRVDLEELHRDCRDMNRDGIYAKLQELIPDYTPYPHLNSAL